MSEISLDDAGILERARAAGCPAVQFETAPTKPIGFYHEKAMEFRDGGPIWVNTLGQGYWVVTSYELVRELFRTPEIFTSDSITPHDPDQMEKFRFIPLNVNPPDHRKYRLILNPWFSPTAIAGREEAMREYTRELVAEIAPLGEQDVDRFCLTVPTVAFLDIVGFPREDTLQFVRWVELFFRFLSGEPAPSPDEKPEMAQAAIYEYISAVIADRRANPRDPESDFFSAMIGEEIDGHPLTDEELKSIGLMLVAAGLDATRAGLGRMFYYLAVHPEIRERVAADFSTIPKAVEESLRVDTQIFGVGRKVSEDVTWHGVDLKKGDMVMALNSAANRDPAVFDDPDTYRIDREIKHHLGFSDGPHKCIGMALAKAEMRIALEEWHKAIPDYELKPGAEMTERGAGLALRSVPLVWPKPQQP